MTYRTSKLKMYGSINPNLRSHTKSLLSEPKLSVENNITMITTEKKGLISVDNHDTESRGKSKTDSINHNYS